MRRGEGIEADWLYRESKWFPGILAGFSALQVSIFSENDPGTRSLDGVWWKKRGETKYGNGIRGIGEAAGREDAFSLA